MTTTLRRGKRLPTRLTACLVAVVVLSGIAAAPAAAVTTVDVYPFPGSRYETPLTQIAFRGVPASQIGSVTVVGSQTGTHGGTLKADSDGNGGSFVPIHPFQSGETVTVTTGLDLTGASTGTFTFKIARLAGQLTAEPLPLAPIGRNGIQRFRSRPDLTPAALTVTKNQAPADSGDIFLAPQFGPTQDGPMILGPQGKLVWFQGLPVKARQLTTDFRVQTLYGKPVLTWFQGTTNNGSGRGEGIIYDQNYQRQAIVRAANGIAMDLHEFFVTPQGQAWFICVEPISVPGRARPIADAVVQEVDIQTGLLEFEWNAMDHIPTSESMRFSGSLPGHILDPFHLNSISFDANGNPVVSARNTSAIYDINRDSGAINWTLGGKASSFTMGTGTRTAFQHDAVVQSDGTITIFDDGAGPPRVHPYSRGIRVAIDTSNHTASLVKQFNHSPQLLADFEGSSQLLPNGDTVLGWGQQPYLSEYNGKGQQVFDAHFNEPTSSYRAYRSAWNAQPRTQPAIAIRPQANGTTEVYASWNGATDVSSWRVLAGNHAGALSPLGSASPTGFETTIVAHTGDPLLSVQALGSQGHVLATSRLVGSGQRVAIYGHSAFVAAGGLTAVPASCFARRACQIVVTVSTGRTVLARSGTQRIAANGSGLLYFRLSSAAQRQLSRANNRRLNASVNVRDGVANTNGTVPLTLIPFRTSGNGPRRSTSHKGSLALLGATDFVSATGIGGILASCSSATACTAKMTISVGKTVIAQPGTESEGGNQVGFLSFQLTAAGRRMLARARGNQLGATVAITGSGGSAGGSIALVSFR